MKVTAMYRQVLAFDFDGTLAESGSIPPELQAALHQLRSAGHALFLVTGRRFERIALGPLGDVFTGIVWENGAVLAHPATDELHQPFGTVNPHLVEALEEAGVPLEHGRAIVATWEPPAETVRQVLDAWGGDAAVVRNKGALMILPPGAAKGTGLAWLLRLCSFSPRNLVAFGDAENDLSLLGLAELGIAVADAVPALQALADVVTQEPGPAGVLEMLEAHWLRGCPPNVLSRHACRIPMGEDETGAPVALPCAALAGGNVGVFGDSGSGKSWVTGLLAEGMHRAGYQVLLIDPEGDFRGLRDLAGMVAVDGDQETLPPPAFVVTLLEEGMLSVVLDLCRYPVTRRVTYVADVLRLLRPLRERKFRPHWIVLEEAQQFLPPNGSKVTAALRPMLADGGWAFVSYRPDRLAQPVLAALTQYLITRLSEPEAMQVVGQALGFHPPELLAEIAPGYVRLGDQCLVRLCPNSRRVPHIRHLYKYLDTPLPAHKRFAFRTEQGYLNIEAASLFEFLQCLPTLPIACLTYHDARGDFAAWAEGALGDGELAAHLRKLSHRSLPGEMLRAALLQRVATRYRELQALR
jgi:hydroxymethylpyrimidine pyrophosphatase-like HAD family hydrolase